MDIILSIVFAIALAFITLKKKAFTPAAAMCAVVILITAGVCADFGGIFIVMAAYGAIFATDLIIGKRAEKITGQINKKTGTRDIVQVLANGLAATVAVVLGKIFSEPAFLAVYAAALAECLADSLASDIGVLSKKDPVDLCRRRRVKRGMSGGVSLLGTVAALCGSAFIAMFSMIFTGFNLKYFLVILLVPMLGMLLDSVLGSLVQAKFTCRKCGKVTEKTSHCGVPTDHTGGVKFINNDTVNIASNFITAAIAALILI